jgi:tetratricopeptide (TPR) repeat protein
VSDVPGRNDPCPCGSGKKYKRCCGLERGPVPPAAGNVTPQMPGTQELGALVALVQQGRLNESEQRARALLERYPRAGMLWKILSVSLLRQGKDALAALRRTAELMPRDAEAHANLGAALHDRGLWSLALESLGRALEINPNEVRALVDSGNAMRALGRARDAIGLYRRALERHAGDAEARNNLGNALMELGDCADAAQCYRLALAIEPENAQIHCNLGNAERQLGLFDEALTSSRRAIELDPSLSVAHLNLGLMLAALGRRGEAVSAYRQALALNPRGIDALNNLGMVLLELNQIEDSAAIYRRALALDARSAPAHVGLARGLRVQGRHTEAESSCRDALAADSKSIEAMSLMGELRADGGQFAEALELFERALSIDPLFCSAINGIAMHRKMGRGDGAWLARAEAAVARRPPLAHEISLRYALGKYHDDVGDYDVAFGHYRIANEFAKRYGSRYDRGKLCRLVDEVIASYDSAAAAPVPSSEDERPVFIVGMPRSGTSLVEQILASHPDVRGVGEVIFWEDAFAARRGGGSQAAPGLEALAPAYLDRVGASAGNALRIVDKMPRNFLYAGLIRAVFSQARIIHMRRHPIDTCLSIYFQDLGAYSNDLEDLAHYYGEYLRAMRHWRAVLPDNALLEVPYEALVANPEAWTRRLLDFLGLSWDARCLDFHRTERVVITASKWQVRQKIHTGSAGRWRRYRRHVAPLLQLVPDPDTACDDGA